MNINNNQQRYFVLTTSKIYYYKEQQKKRIRGCINFKIADAKITVKLKRDVKLIYNCILIHIYQDVDGERFCIDIQGYKRKFELKSNAKYTSQEWINLINIVIEENTQIMKPMINTIKLNQYFKNDLMTEQEFLSYIESGDILLFE